MKIKTQLILPTSLTTANNYRDSDSSSNLSSYLNDAINKIDYQSEAKLSTPIGDLVFTIFIDKLCAVSEDNFKIEIEIQNEYSGDESEDQVWDILSDSKDWQIKILDPVKQFVEHINSNLNLYVPYKESFKFENGRYWIEQDPLEPYKPEFVKFAIVFDADEDQIEENLIVT